MTQSGLVYQDATQTDGTDLPLNKAFRGAEQVWNELTTETIRTAQSVEDALRPIRS